VDDDECLNTKPSSREDCEIASCDTYSWSVGEWSSCSATCDLGTKTRTISCVNQDGNTAPDAKCDSATLEESEKACDIGIACLAEERAYRCTPDKSSYDCPEGLTSTGASGYCIVGSDVSLTARYAACAGDENCGGFSTCTLPRRDCEAGGITVPAGSSLFFGVGKKHRSCGETPNYDTWARTTFKWQYGEYGVCNGKKQTRVATCASATEGAVDAEYAVALCGATQKKLTRKCTA